ncbi:MAG: DUF5343 domain-containing protein [Defluviicoccus sp.]|nr:DUF5343 domain-containing protein [Defluviicoccus sp.]MDG4608453.1 DUF5343 domain-containing protein [Defluviicoccus sp.]
MADKHPYVSAQGGLAQVINHFRKSFPQTVSADTLRKLGFAPKNESYVLNVLRHLKLIDEEGQRTASAQTVFSQHGDADFAKGFGDVVKEAYPDLFELHGKDSWTLEQNSLITFFRSTDQTTDIVGTRQAKTFQTLAAFAGYKETPSTRQRYRSTAKDNDDGRTVKRQGSAAVNRNAKNTRIQGREMEANSGPAASNFGLTVRVEINLPADGDQETYDRIFKSIRENLLNA